MSSACGQQVGDAFAGKGRCDMVFELYPRPTAPLTFASVLEEEGHAVHRRCAFAHKLDPFLYKQIFNKAT